VAKTKTLDNKHPNSDLFNHLKSLINVQPNEIQHLFACNPHYVRSCLLSKAVRQMTEDEYNLYVVNK